jgi:hypothetical protein
MSHGVEHWSRSRPWPTSAAVFGHGGRRDVVAHVAVHGCLWGAPRSQADHYSAPREHGMLNPQIEGKVSQHGRSSFKRNTLGRCSAVHL